MYPAACKRGVLLSACVCQPLSAMRAMETGRSVTTTVLAQRLLMGPQISNVTQVWHTPSVPGLIFQTEIVLVNWLGTRIHNLSKRGLEKMRSKIYLFP